MNDQQRDLLDLLNVARGDLLAGRPAERTSHALMNALRCIAYTDMTDGSADDQKWRITRIPTALEPRAGVET